MWKKILALFHRRKLDRDMRDELEAHLAHKKFYLERQGLPPAEAERQARRALGNLTATHEKTRSEWTFPGLESVGQDIVYGARLLRKDIGFTAVILLTLMVSIGANTAIFQLLNALLWQPLPVTAPGQLARIRAINLPPTDKAWSNGRSVPATERLQIPYPLYRLLANRKDLFTDQAGIMGQGKFALDLGDSSHPVHSSVVSGSYFPLLGLTPAVGRLIDRTDDVQGGPASGWGAVISYKLWKGLFGGSPDVVGRRVRIERIPFQILGVAPEGFDGVHPGVEVSLYIPISSFESMFPEWNWRENTSQWTVQTFARLRPNARLEEVNQTLHKISESLLTEVADLKLNGEDLKHHKAIQLDAVSARSGFSHVVRNYSPILWLLLGAAGAVLLLAVTNLTNLMLARTQARKAEMATRLALGASPARLRRQLLLETSLLAVAGIALGIVFAQWATQGLLLAISNDDAALPLKIEPGWQAVAFLSLLLVIVMWIAGWLPATAATAQATHQRTASRRDTGLRAVLVVLQIGLTLTLLGGAALMSLSLRSLVQEPTGFRQTQTAYFTPDLINAGLSKERIPQVYTEVLRQTRSRNQVVAAAWVRDIPLSGSLQASSIEIPNRKLSNSLTMIQQVTDGYFKTMGIPLLAGEDFESSDSSRRDTAIASSSLAKHYFGGDRQALGQRIRIGQGKWLTIIGVAADSKYAHIRDGVSPTLYTNYGDSRSTLGLTLVVHYSGQAARVREAVNAILLEQVGRRPFLKLQTPEQILEALLATDRTLTIVLAGFAAFAVLIATTGIVGLLGYVVQLRRKEIGIRLALGATRASIQSQFLKYAVALALPGLLLGALLSYALHQSIRSFLFQARVSDPWVWIATASFLITVSLLAAALPARRASRMDPQEVLRTD